MSSQDVRRRLDQILVERGLADSRAKAQALILAGAVHVERRHGVKPGTLLPADIPIEMNKPPAWVGRGGEKLAGAIAAFDLAKKIRGAWLDCGASTGGFTDVLLAHGAEKVYAIDVGYGQLALKLRDDPRVVVIERFNIRNITKENVPDPLDGATLDLSFISSRLVLPLLPPYLKPDARVILLFKPQFEGERRDVGRGGIVRDDATRERIVAEFEAWAARNGWAILGKTFSPITGRDGNVELLFLLAPDDFRPENML